MPAQLREAVLQVTSEHIPLGIDGRDLDDARLWEILLYASMHRITIESACHEPAQTPSGNTVRERLGAALDDHRSGVVQLEEQINSALRAQLPRCVRRRLSQLRFEIAIDLHDIPYRGQPALGPDEVRRGPAKSGITHFYSYATLAIVHDQLGRREPGQSSRTLDSGGKMAETAPAASLYG